MSDDPDVERLREDVDRIKEAMGLAERYEGLTEQWLLFGVLVAVASAVSQYVVLNDLPGYWHAVAWLGLMFGGGAIGMWWLLPGGDLSNLRPRSDKPGIFFIFGVAYLLTFPLQIVIQAYVGPIPAETESIFTFSIVLLMVGLSYVMMGNAMRAYRIRNRDRYALHVGGVLLVGLGTAIPFVEFLRTWAYATFGTVYIVYAAVVYLVLTRT